MKKYLFYVIFLFTVQLTAQPFSGIYTVNAGLPASATNFQSLAALADSISLHGISGPVIIGVVSGSGPYHEQIWFRNIAGMDAFNTITLNGGGETFSALTSSTNRHVLRVEGVSYFNINNFIVDYDTNSTGGFYGIHIYNAADHVTVNLCAVHMVGNSTLHGGIICSGSETSILEAGDFHNILINGNLTSGGGYGVSLFGEATNLSTNVVITNNNLNDWHSNGIYLRETNGVLVDNNFLEKNDAMITSANAIQLAQAANINGVISNNLISIGQTNNGTMRIRGIYLFNGAGHKVYNNFILSQLVSGDFTGIEVRTGGTAPAISFNTILLDNPNAATGDLTGIAEELSGTNSMLRNNLISITQPTSGRKAALLIGATASPTTAFNTNYNNLHEPGGHTCVKDAITPINFTSLAAWQSTSGQDMNSWDLDPVFAISAPSNPALDNKGISIPGISEDFSGNPRAFTPDIGAHEFLTVNLSEVAVSPFSGYPNPANDYFIVDTSLDNCSAVLVGSTGALHHVGVFSSDSRLYLDTSTLADGFYSLIITTGLRRWVQKLIVQH